VGCGTGLMAEILMHRGHHVVGLDLGPEGLYITHKALPQSWLLQAEATRLPLKENAFDAVMLLDILEHVDDRILLAEARRVLRPGGAGRNYSTRDAVAVELQRRSCRPSSPATQGDSLPAC